MKRSFAETLLDARKQQGLSQQQLADRLFVNRSSVANWESGRRLPDATMISMIAKELNVNVSELIDAASKDAANPAVVMVVDDNVIVLNGELPVIETVLPYATVVGFTKPSQAVEFAKANRVSLALLDVELGSTSGIDLCRKLLDVNPHTNVVFLTAYEEYSMEAWSTEASGFMLKPLTVEGVRAELKKLRHPFTLGGAYR